MVDAALSDARLQPSDDTAIAALLSDRIVASLKPNSYLLAQEDPNCINALSKVLHIH